jgi:hypothetical protein
MTIISRNNIGIIKAIFISNESKKSKVLVNLINAIKYARFIYIYGASQKILEKPPGSKYLNISFMIKCPETFDSLYIYLLSAGNSGNF